MSDRIILCACGCNQPVPIAKFPSQQRKYISGHQPAATRPLAVRFWEKVSKRGPNDCWKWQGSLDRKGYGQIKLHSHQRGSAHRVSYELHFGPIPDNLFVCHRCDNPSCVNPAHLFLGTGNDNLRDMREKGRHSHGETHAHAKLTEKQVDEIRARYAAGGILQRELALEYGVTEKHISRIINRGQWNT